MINKYFLIVLLSVLSVVSLACANAVKTYSEIKDIVSPAESVVIVSPSVSGLLDVYFVDVGQGDCTIYWYNKTNALIIDAGSGSQATRVIDFVNRLGINHFDIAIATHPDEDHIGSLDDVINTFGVDKVYAPRITKDTVAFSNFATSVKNQGIKITPPISGDIFQLGVIPFQILAPNSSEYDATNNYSIVTRVVYGQNSFLNMGDAETLSEKEIISRGYELRSEVMKIGHHGSITSTSEGFFNRVNPAYVIVSVGKDNKYDHPDKEIIERISLSSIVYRTDLNGTISFSMENGDRASVWTTKK
jgi:competence protein ComEC